MQISKFYREAFGHLLFFIVFQPLAVNPPHSSMLPHHKHPFCPTIRCRALMCLPQFHSDLLVANRPSLANSFHVTPCSLHANPEESNILQTFKSPAFFKHRPLLFARAIHAAHVGGHYYSVQTQSSLSQLMKHHIVTTRKRIKYL